MIPRLAKLGPMAPTTLVVVTVLLSCGSPAAEKGTLVQGEYLLLNHLDRIEAPSTWTIKVPSLEIGQDMRRALPMHPPFEARFSAVPAHEGGRLALAPALNPAAYDKPTDGVVFEVRCRDAAGDWIELLELELAPRQRPQDRGWQDREVSLAVCSRPTTEVLLRTTCGPLGDCKADWALWGEPSASVERDLKMRPSKFAVLISVDTLRPDRLRLYGGPRDNSPNLERVAADGIVFETAIAPSPWTIPSHATLLTSRDPRVHRADAHRAIAPGVATLADVLSTAGWQTAAFVDSPYLSSEFGFDRGFEHFDYRPAPPSNYRHGARAVLERVIDWLESADERPAFIFWHIMDAHAPYGAPAPHGGRFRASLDAADRSESPQLRHLEEVGFHDHLRLDRYASFDELLASYDEGLAHVDGVVGRLFDLLQATGRWNDSTIVVTSDHGESFLDEDIYVGHGLFLTDAELRIPLLLKLPRNRGAGTRPLRIAGAIDIAPTLLNVLGVATPPQFEGRSLLGGMDGRRDALLFGYSNNIGASFVRSQQQMYVTEATVPPEVIRERHLRAAPPVKLPLAEVLAERLETTDGSDLSSESLETLGALRRILMEHRTSLESEADSSEEPIVPSLSDEELDRLRSLGYVGSDG
ncbi:MAG: sulfatase [Acidobacteriota bacterium]